MLAHNKELERISYSRAFANIFIDVIVFEIYIYTYRQTHALLHVTTLRTWHVLSEIQTLLRLIGVRPVLLVHSARTRRSTLHCGANRYITKMYFFFWFLSLVRWFVLLYTWSAKSSVLLFSNLVPICAYIARIKRWMDTCWSNRMLRHMWRRSSKSQWL